MDLRALVMTDSFRKCGFEYIFYTVYDSGGFIRVLKRGKISMRAYGFYSLPLYYLLLEDYFINRYENMRFLAVLIKILVVKITFYLFR